jgi:hypothetical protein
MTRWFGGILNVLFPWNMRGAMGEKSICRGRRQSSSWLE